MYKKFWLSDQRWHLRLEEFVTLIIKLWNEYLYRYSGDTYSLPKRKTGDCCGVVDNSCIHYYWLATSISG